LFSNNTLLQQLRMQNRYLTNKNRTDPILPFTKHFNDSMLQVTLAGLSRVLFATKAYRKDYRMAAEMEQIYCGPRRGLGPGHWVRIGRFDAALLRKWVRLYVSTTALTASALLSFGEGIENDMVSEHEGGATDQRIIPYWKLHLIHNLAEVGGIDTSEARRKYNVLDLDAMPLGDEREQDHRQMDSLILVSAADYEVFKSWEDYFLQPIKRPGKPIPKPHCHLGDLPCAEFHPFGEEYVEEPSLDVPSLLACYPTTTDDQVRSRVCLR
jgi:hypothetical protein